MPQEESPFKEFAQQPTSEQPMPVEQEVIVSETKKRSNWKIWVMVLLIVVISVGLGFYFLR